jgi:hypothetical protein
MFKQPITSKPESVTARLPFSASFLPLAMELVAKGADGFGYKDREASSLVLAMEELFSFYARQVAGDSVLEIILEDQGYRLALTLAFQMAHPDLRAFNLTWRVNPDNEESLEMLGPMLAARTVSGLRMDFGADELVVLRVTRDRDYAPAHDVALPPPDLTQAIRLVAPSADDVRHFAAMTASSMATFMPKFLTRSGMAAAMFAAGHLHALLANSGDWIIGGVLWRPLTDTCLELYGPYLFTNDPDDLVLTLLLDEAIGRIARSAYRGVLRRQGALARHERFFDFLGDLELQGVDGMTKHCVYYYRQLREDSGGVVYCNDPLAAFLHTQYERLCLPRQVRARVSDDAQLRDTSVLAIELEQARSLAIIRPLCAGKDMATNLAAHLDLLRRNRISNFQVEINTGRGDDTAFAGPLADTGFVPRLLVPDAGLGDLVIYDHGARDGLS